MEKTYLYIPAVIVGKVYADRSEITENITQANELGVEVVERFQTKG